MNRNRCCTANRTVTLCQFPVPREENGNVSSERTCQCELLCNVVQVNTVERFRLSWNDVLTSFIDRLAEYAHGDDPLFEVFGLNDTTACVRA